jgi:putative ubiquitin-RnfH superfamily antitoxin RatB of RatAB toxin-antitoxin module
MPDRPITVTVVYAEAGRHVLRQVELPGDSTVMQAIDVSGIAAMLPDDAIDPGHLSIFARRVPPTRVVREGDRVEICRPLLRDPMEARRRRARQT